MIRALGIFILSCFWLDGQCQVNLVPNGSFEEYIVCPTGVGIDGFLQNWFEPTDCTPDLFHDCGGAIPVFSVYPHSGSGMMRMYLWSSSGDREYAEVKLIQPLVAGEKYEFTVYMRLFNEFVSRVGSFGVVLSEDSVTEFTGWPVLLSNSPSLQRDPNSIMNDTSIWYSYVDTFQAIGNEEFMIIGNFLSNADTPIEVVSNVAAGYHFDDVSLIHIEDTLTSIRNDGIVGVEIKTNPVVSDILELNSTEQLQLVMLDLSGKQVLSHKLKIGKNEVQLLELQNGIYIAVFSNENGAKRSEKLLLLR